MTAKQSVAVRKLVLTSLFLCVGVLLPFMTSHAFGVQGTVFLPMHIPVLLCGFLLGGRYGLIAGILTPVLSCFLTGMPAFYPMLPIMVCELTIYGLAGGLLYQKWHLPLAFSLPIAMVLGRVVYGLVFALLMALSETTLKALSVFDAVVTGLPGIAIQLVLVPVLVQSLKKYMVLGETPRAQQSEMFLRAKKLVEEKKANLVIIKNGRIVYQDKGMGVKSLINIYHTQREILQGAFVVDKIIGKAAATILILGGAKQCHAKLLSFAAKEFLKNHGISVTYGTCIDVLKNREGNGICPIEKSILEYDDPEAAFGVFTATLERLRKSS